MENLQPEIKDIAKRLNQEVAVCARQFGWSKRVARYAALGLRSRKSVCGVCVYTRLGILLIGVFILITMLHGGFMYWNGIKERKKQALFQLL